MFIINLRADKGNVWRRINTFLPERIHKYLRIYERIWIYVKAARKIINVHILWKDFFDVPQELQISLYIFLV